MSNPLRCCPVCSNPPAFFTPVWVFSTMVSAKRGEDHFNWASTCQHSRAIFGFDPVAALDRPAIECRWTEATEHLFAERTARWTLEERSRFRRLLGYDPQIDAGQADLPAMGPEEPPSSQPPGQP